MMSKGFIKQHLQIISVKYHQNLNDSTGFVVADKKDRETDRWKNTLLYSLADFLEGINR